MTYHNMIKYVEHKVYSIDYSIYSKQMVVKRIKNYNLPFNI